MTQWALGFMLRYVRVKYKKKIGIINKIVYFFVSGSTAGLMKKWLDGSILIKSLKIEEAWGWSIV